MNGAGDYKHRVRFDRAVDTIDDDTGEPMRAWEPLQVAWSRVEPLRGREAFIADGVESTADTLISTRYSSLMATVRAKDRAYFPQTDTYYNIEAAIDVDTAHRELQFRCSSGLNAG